MPEKRYYHKPDFSDHVIHFTKDVAPLSKKEYPTDGAIATITGMKAKERLFKILSDKCIHSTIMPWTDKRAVCFTESTWQGLVYHSRQYSKYGIGFSKSFLFSHGGGPAIYLAPGLMDNQKKHVGEALEPFEPTLASFITVFCPEYASREYKKAYWPRGQHVDFSHEREWRVPQDLNFNYKDVSFVIVASYKDMAEADKKIKDKTGRNNWLSMDNYEKVEELWPIHFLPKYK